MKGTVKFFKADKGYGFIAASNGDEYFVHVSNLLNTGSLNKGEDVEFDVVDGKKGKEAQNVSIS